MNPRKFNPIDPLTLPGADVVKDLEAHATASKYPPTEVADKIENKPQIEISLKPAAIDEEEEYTPEQKESHRVTLVRAVILIALIILVFVGILLTLQVVPKVLSKLPNFGQAFNYVFVSKNSTTTPATTTISATPIKNAGATVTATTSAQTTPSAKRAPDHILGVVMSTNYIGNQTIVKFNIQNVGETTSGTWSFSVRTAENPTPVYYSTAQNPLTPKSGSFYTLSFPTTQYSDLPVIISIFN